MSDIEKIKEYVKNNTYFSDYFKDLSQHMLLKENYKSIYIDAKSHTSLTILIFVVLRIILGIKKSIKLVCYNKLEHKYIGAKPCDEIVPIMEENRIVIYKAYYEYDDEIKSPSVIQYIVTTFIDLWEPDSLYRFLHDVHVEVLTCQSILENYVIDDIRCKDVLMRYINENNGKDVDLSL